jgi:hypothetical protein
MNWWQVGAVCAAILVAGRSAEAYRGSMAHNILCIANALERVRDHLEGIWKTLEGIEAALRERR